MHSFFVLKYLTACKWQLKVLKSYHIYAHIECFSVSKGGMAKIYPPDLSVRDVLPVLELDEILLAVDDAQDPVRVERPDVPRLKPPLPILLVEALRGLLGVLEVPHGDVIPPDVDLTPGTGLVRDPVVPVLPVDQLDVDVHERGARPPGSPVPGGGGGGAGGGLGEAVALNDRHAEAGPAQALCVPGERCSAGQDNTHLAAQQVPGNRIYTTKETRIWSKVN